MKFYIREDNEIKYTCSDLYAAKSIAETNPNYTILEDLSMANNISRTIYVLNKESQEKICVYNNKEFWLTKAEQIFNNYNDYIVYDILNREISKDRFGKELFSNRNRICLIDELQGQVAYNIEVGNEFITLFRLECIKTNFTKESDTSPMIIFEKLTPVIAMLDTGAFREAKQYLQEYRAKIKDDFLTDGRIDKYIAMLDAADAIEYATDETYFYTAPEGV